LLDYKFTLPEHEGGGNSSVSTGWRTRVQFLGGTCIFSLFHLIHKTCGVHPASYLMGTGGPYSGSRATEGVKLTTHLHSPN